MRRFLLDPVLTKHAAVRLKKKMCAHGVISSFHWTNPNSAQQEAPRGLRALMFHPSKYVVFSPAGGVCVNQSPEGLISLHLGPEAFERPDHLCAGRRRDPHPARLERVDSGVVEVVVGVQPGEEVGQVHGGALHELSFSRRHARARGCKRRKACVPKQTGLLLHCCTNRPSSPLFTTLRKNYWLYRLVECTTQQD